MKTIFVTGGTGYVGTSVIRSLRTAGVRIRALLRKTPAVPLQDAEIRIGDLSDPNALTAAMKGCDAVIHLAVYARNWARDPRIFDETNVSGTKRVCAAALAAGVRRMVHTSSVLTVGPSNGAPIDESARPSLPPLTDYERTKIAAEQAVEEFVRGGLDAVIVNPTRIFGPGPLTEANSISIMVRDYLAGRWHVLPGNGAAVGNYAFVEDVARGIVRALEHGRTGERYILGGENLSYRRLFDVVEEVSGESRFLVPVPERAVGFFSRLELLRAKFFHGYPLITPGWVATLFQNAPYSCAKAERELGYSFTPFATAMRATIDWLRAGGTNSGGI